uniref:Uncharacterized protein n=1 Tax=Steinernema glaseri TaxID=37863 RepID=A0A1I8A3P0_9BILA
MPMSGIPPNNTAVPVMISKFFSTSFCNRNVLLLMKLFFIHNSRTQRPLKKQVISILGKAVLWILADGEPPHPKWNSEKNRGDQMNKDTAYVAPSPVKSEKKLSSLFREAVQIISTTQCTAPSQEGVSIGLLLNAGM